MCWSVLNGCCPTQGTPSPPICVKPTVLRSIQMVMKWQPMPAMARLPSGTRVLVLCGQPEQNQGRRSAPLPAACTVLRVRSEASSTANWRSRRACMSLSMPRRVRRWAMARAICAGVRSAVAGSSTLAVGLARAHSPPEKSPAAPSWYLPSTLGRTSGRQLYSSSFNWYSMTWRFSSTTRISRRPVANSRVICASSGHTTPTLCRRMPSCRQAASSRPRSSSAWRVSLKALPLAMMPSRSFGPAMTS